MRVSLWIQNSSDIYKRLNIYGKFTYMLYAAAFKHKHCSFKLKKQTARMFMLREYFTNITNHCVNKQEVCPFFFGLISFFVLWIRLLSLFSFVFLLYLYYVQYHMHMCVNTNCKDGLDISNVDNTQFRYKINI